MVKRCGNRFYRKEIAILIFIFLDKNGKPVISPRGKFLYIIYWPLGFHLKLTELKVSFPFICLCFFLSFPYLLFYFLFKDIAKMVLLNLGFQYSTANQISFGDLKYEIKKKIFFYFYLKIFPFIIIIISIIIFIIIIFFFYILLFYLFIFFLNTLFFEKKNVWLVCQEKKKLYSRPH